MVNQIIFSSLLQTWYVELRISRSISESPLEFEITRVDCITIFWKKKLPYRELWNIWCVFVREPQLLLSCLPKHFALTLKFCHSYVSRVKQKVLLNMCIFRPSWACANYHLGFCFPFIHSVSGQGTCSDHGCTSWSGPLLSTYSQTHVFTWCELFNLYHSLGIFSRRQIDDIFLIFPRKQDLTFHANCLLETICMKCQILFSRKNKKNISKCRLLKIFPRVLNVNFRIFLARS